MLRSQEWDIVLLSHRVIARGPGIAEQEEVRQSSSLVSYGDNPTSAIAKAAGFPVVFAQVGCLG